MSEKGFKITIKGAYPQTLLARQTRNKLKLVLLPKEKSCALILNGPSNSNSSKRQAC